MKKAELKAAIEASIRIKKPTQEAIQRFVDDFDAGLKSGWTNFIPSSVPSNLVEFLSPANFLKDIKKLEKLSHEHGKQVRQKEKAILQSAIKLEAQLRGLYSYFEKQGLGLQGLAEENLTQEIASSLDTLISLFIKSKQQHKVGGGKKKAEKSMIAAHVCAMAECLLNVQIYKNNSGNSPLSKVLIACFHFAKVDELEEAQTYILKCYESEETLSQMYTIYRHYEHLEKFAKLLERTHLPKQSKIELAEQWSLGD